MSTLLEQASLVMIPSGYKEDVVYSQIPTNGNGDLSFTRASNGTRVNSAGLVEVCPWNLVQQSETFDNATWTKANVTISANTTTAPNGTTTADSIIENTALSTHVILQSATLSATTYTYSVYVKAISGSNRNVGILFNSTGKGVLINPSNGSVVAYFGTTSADVTITSIGNEWFRVSVTATTSAITESIRIYLGNGTTWTAPYQGDGTSGAFIWGAQLNEGATAKPYFPTTDRLNVPRLTYQNGGGGCPSLLLEPQRTNLSLWSEDFSNVVWLKLGGSSVTANTTTAPDGTTTADTLSLTTNASSSVAQSIVLATTTTITISVYAKVSSGTKDFRLRTDNPTTTQAFTATTSWQRFSMTATPTVTTSAYVINDLAGTAGDLIIWGFQVEVGAYPTSYIPTTTASATRVADAARKTGISSLIGQTEGTMFLDFRYEVAQTSRFAISDGTGTNWIFFSYPESTNQTRVRIAASGITAIDSTSSAVFTANENYKIALAYKSGSWALYINGTLILSGTQTFTFNNTLSVLLLSGAFSAVIPGEVYGKVNQAILFPTRLTNAELASLTTI